MVTDYKLVSIYADPDNYLIIIPCGKSQRFKVTMNIDLVTDLKPPYSPEELEEALFKAMEQCYTIIPDDSSKISVIEKFLGIRGYAKAVKGKKYVAFRWNIDDGFSVTPSVKKKGFESLEEQSIKLGKKFEKGALADAVKKAIELSIS